MTNQPFTIATHLVPNDLSPTRLSDYCVGIFTQLPSKKSVKKAIKAGRIQVENEIKDTGYWVESGKTIELLESSELTDTEVFETTLEIVFEDDYFAVINKPAGLAVSGNYYKTIANALPYNLKKSTAPDALRKPLPVHRLDGMTSGLLLVSKTKTASISLGQQFENQSITKHYQALAMGEIPASGVIDTPVDDKNALTHFTVEQSISSLQSEQLSLVNLFPQTGRTHQLRVHLSSIGCPILGDTLYGHEGHILKGKGLFLCAVGIEFSHPISHKKMRFTIDPPNKFKRRLALEEKRWKIFNPKL